MVEDKILTTTVVSNLFLGRGPRYVKAQSGFYPVGIEIEAENVHATSEAIPNGWLMTTDGSLRNRGVELVSQLPIRSAGGVEAKVGRACAMLQEHDATTSIRTGIHVHVNMQDITLAKLRNILLAYALAEPALYAYCGEDRENNPYCIPWYDAPDALVSYSRFCHSPHSPVLIRRVVGVNKYSGLYIGPLGRFGTIEFRHLPTTLDPRRVIEWVNILQNLCKIGEETDYAQLLCEVDHDDLVQTLLPELGLAAFSYVYDDVDVGHCMYKVVPWLRKKIDPSLWKMVNLEKSEVRERRPIPPHPLHRDFINDLLAMGRPNITGGDE